MLIKSNIYKCTKIYITSICIIVVTFFSNLDKSLIFRFH